MDTALTRSVRELEDIRIDADPEQLRIVFSNLLLNAAQAMERRFTRMRDRDARETSRTSCVKSRSLMLMKSARCR